MNSIRFVWDNNKAILNKKKHGVSFEEAQSVFYDPDHSRDEDRFIMLGLSAAAREIVVCYCVREGGEAIRVITARKAVKSEAGHYWKERK